MIIDPKMLDSKPETVDNYIEEGRYTVEIVDEKTCANGALCIVYEVAAPRCAGFRFCDFFNLDNDRDCWRFKELAAATTLDNLTDSAQLIGERIDIDVVVNTYTDKTGTPRTKNRARRFHPISLQNKQETRIAADKLASSSYGELPF